MVARPKLAFITGASSGLGQALAGRYHQAGFELALVGRRTSEIEAWAKSRKISAESYKIYSVNVAEPDSIITAAEACLAQQGVPDVVLACAGMSVGVDTAQRGDLDVMAQTFATNNLGTAATFHAFIKPMAVRKTGTLVGLASVNGVRGFAGHGANCPSKAEPPNSTDAPLPSPSATPALPARTESSLSMTHPGSSDSMLRA